MSKHDYSQRSYIVVPFDPNWPTEFEKIRRIITPVFGNLAEQIEHIGSTAIPGMISKPTIDVLVVIRDVSEVDALNPQMGDLGYRALGEYVAPGGRLFAFEKDGDRLVNIHCFPSSHPKTRGFLSLRDYLRTNPEELKAYAQLKADLFRQYPTDYGMYRKEKDAYVKELSERAEQWWSRQVTE